MDSRKGTRHNTQIKRHVKRILWLLAGVCAFVTLVGYLEAQALNAARGYVRGEGIWAKARRDAVSHLHDYLNEPDDASFQAYEKALQVILDYKIARIEMLKPVANKDVAMTAMLKAGSDPEDAIRQYWLTRLAGDVGSLRDAMTAWTEADQHIVILETFANRLRTSHRKNPSASLRAFRRELDAIDAHFTGLENKFSLKLGEGSRWMSDRMMEANIVLLLLVFLMAWMIGRNIIADIDRTERKLRESESRFRALSDTHLIGIILWNFQGDLLDANDAFLEMVGYSREDLMEGRLNWKAITPEQYQPLDDLSLQQVKERGYCDPFLKAYRRKTGELVDVLVGGAMVDGSYDRCISFVLDRRKEKQIEDQLQLAATVLESSLDGILIADQRQVILTVNDAYCHMVGREREELVGSTVHFGTDGIHEESADISASLNEHGFWQGDTKLTLACGATLAVRASMSAVRDSRGAVLHYVAAFADISVRKKLEQELKNLAHFDPLTGLANRSLFADRLDTALRRAQRNQYHCALLFIDLDKFKPVNDQYGHGVGDMLLLQVAQRLKNVVRESDTISRVGGDEFVAIIEGVNCVQSAVTISEKLVAQLEEPFMVGDLRLHIGCSIGISIYPDHANSGVALMRAADMAMYIAKAQANQRVHVYNSLN